ncbi:MULTISPECIES: FeoA family protein [unclassified Gordonia (in: high G+C Gram-positive bacteria)]|uniref:FeoA family protein n=1 Tax=unclassified Gordonia (in: high G+C Gram-positive bacteria) TaxID=2657482 RepID=UPI001F114A51|nr:FeoA family protein [Gordonia sp. ABSL49_1]MCH5644384.1 ferrous iron transport protein A [Gordonia sp. ABSL49_1]
MAASTMPMARLNVGQSARIHGFSESCPPEIRHRLASLGFIHGTTVCRMRRAPLGDPSVYRVMDYEICFRRHEADFIECDVAS